MSLWALSRNASPGLNWKESELLGRSIALRILIIGEAVLYSPFPVMRVACTTFVYLTCSNGDPIFMRNHYPRRTVLGIIARDGAMAEYTSLPAANLFEVPDAITDKEAVFTEPLAAACRVLEQQVRC